VARLSASPRLVLFDIDGTLLRAAGAGRRALERTFRSVFGVTEIATAAAGVRFEGGTDPRIIAEMADCAGISRAELHRKSAELRSVYLDALRDELARPDPRRAVTKGAIDLLERLRTLESVRLGLITGNIEAGAMEKLRAFDLDHYFDDGGFSSDHEDRGEIARIARERMSRRTGIPFRPEQTVVVGDTEHDVACARANGYAVVLVESGWIPRERLVAARPDALFPDFGDAAAVLAALGIEAAGQS